MPDRFAQWLDITMSNRGIKGTDLARKIGVHDSAISRWRNAQGIPSLDAVMKLASALDVDPLRLAVTARLMDSEAVHVEPLPPPEPTARREYVREQIKQIKGLDRHEVARLLAAYDGGGLAHDGQTS